MSDMKEVVKAIIEAQIVTALKETPDFVEGLVKAAMLDHKVDRENGRGDGYSSNKVTYLDYLVGQTIRDAARSSVAKILGEMMPEIEAAVRKAMSADDVAAAMAKAVIRSAEQEWAIKVSFEKERER